ncbi:FAD-binding protein [Rubneribacter badeniensis]|uniref:FAD-binding protein n=1 Tax=Rubneribacter badeniensis TaxID=2070688 RepID=A0A9D2VLL6_9ACTN|nr:Urocanate reductase precursor [Coriobacteriaceae bacterium CHKCI002]HJH43722.1 FAD-binding protein [Rubneribacter badeniensis]
MEKESLLSQSRRTFLKTASVALAGVAGLGIAGCAPKGTSGGNETGTAAGTDTKWDEEFDVVVIGAGCAGQAAAITVALEGNGATCLLAEKGTMPGGNSPYCKGTIVYAEDEDAFNQYMLEMRGEEGTTPDDVIAAYAKGAVENYPWVFETLGASLEEASIVAPSTMDDPLATAPEWPEFEHCYALGKLTVAGNKDIEIKGDTHITKLLDRVISDHADVIEYRTDAPMSELIQDPSTKRILGAVIDGKNVKANRGVIMCTGGFEANPVMRQDFIGQGGAEPAINKLNTGDGHKACMKVGADFWHMEHVAGFWMAGRDLENTKFTNNQIISPCPKQFGITVGVNGRRYYMDWDGYSNKSDIEYMDDPSLAVGSRHGHMQIGGEWPHLAQPRRAWFVFDQAGLEAGAIPAETTSDPVADNLAYAADTIEELAAQMNVPADELKTTVDQWNECCANGKDIFFHRPASTLTPVATPPFYAQLCIPSFLNTDGGPVRNAQGEILDPDGNPIPGLYSAGEFGSIWSGVYQGGGNVAECLIFGRISARSALANA